MNSFSLRTENLGILHEGGRTFSANDLRQLAEAKKKSFSQAGVGLGSRVLLPALPNADFFAQLFALWELGACAVPVSPVTKPAEINSLARKSGATFFLHAQGLTALPADSALPITSQPDLILFSSGSGGPPKGVMHSREAVLGKVRTLAKWIPAEQTERSLCVLPLHFGHGLIGNSLFPLLNGQELFLYGNFNAALAAQLGALIDRHEISFLSSVPALWRLALTLGSPPQQKSLRRVHCASSPLSLELYRQIVGWCPPATLVKNIYGTTETASWVASLPDDLAYSETGLIGQGLDAKLGLDAQGEIFVESPSLMLGYCDGTESASLREGRFFTGDLGRTQSSDSGPHSPQIVIEGRRKELIDKAGEKIFPGEVEAVLAGHAAVADTCVFSRPHSIFGECVAAALAVREGAPEPTTTELEQWCLERLSPTKVPDVWFFLPVIPRNTRGKVDREELERLCPYRVSK